ncbi:serine-rich adhesin for platelets-like isoform X3 [Ostrea edulis]|uniref:serine-rich adhesin for platelets-like isoform X3 n=1 Tax=Ostrea edulis TaxID=37623 RepID=UPI0024AEDC3E|nr:serine-rich adhesin for platelets-like isoform X3 [Ostrea edulis]
MTKVKCGSVFVTSKDTVQKIKSTILTTNIKHKKSGKHAVALGTSFGHVHSFLKDDLHLLQKLEAGHDQCLMLIKKPKSSAKQMLKSQSWSNLASPSDSGIFHKADEEDFKKRLKSKMKKKPSSDYRLAPVRDLSPQNNSCEDGGFLSHPPNSMYRWRKMDDTASDLSVSSGYKSLDRKDHSSFLRRSQPRDMQINSPQLRKDGRRYQSHNDIYFQSPKKVVNIQPEEDSCTIKSDEFYSETNTQANTTLTSELDESKDQEKVPRSHSLGDLSTGLTLSLVGQRKAESIQSLPLASQKVTQKKTSYAKRKTESKGQLRHPKGNKNKQSIESQIQSIIQARDDGDVTPTTPEINATPTQPIICKSNSSSQMMKENALNNVQRALKADLLPDKHGINMTKSEKDEDNSSDKSNQSSRSTVKTPNRPRRTLPTVPKGSEEAGEKKKKYTDMMKMRVSLHSSNSCGSLSRQSILSPGSESVSQNDSQTDTPSDKEVSELFNGHSAKLHRHSHLTDCQMVNSNGIPFNGNVHSSLPSGLRSCDSGQTTLRSCDSGQATLMSLSSTVDSGYHTTDAESDISSYTRSLQISAHNFYSSNKLNGYGLGSGPKQETDRSFLNAQLHQISPKQQPVSRNIVYPCSIPTMQPSNPLVHSSQSQMSMPFTAQMKSPSVERQAFPPTNVHIDKAHEVIRRNSASMMQSEKGRNSSSHPDELNNQNARQQIPKDSNVTENGKKVRPQSAQTSSIRIQDNTVSSTQCLMENSPHPKIMPTSTGHSIPHQGEHQYLVKTISADKSVKKDLMDNFSPENYLSHSTPTSKGLSYSNTLPRSTNPYNQKVLSSSVKQFSSPQPVNFTGSGTLNCDTNQMKSKYTSSCQAESMNQKQVNANMKYSLEGPGQNNNNTYMSTSVQIPATSGYHLQNKLTAKVFNHDYVNVQGREIRLGIDYDSVDPNTSDSSNIYEEYHTGCQECSKQEFQSQGPLFPKNNLPETVIVPQNAGAKVPSLFQLLQSYDLHPLFLKFCDNLPASNFITFSDCSIVLSNIKQDKRDAIAISTPQGKCATIGGPGSAFTPVKNAVVSTSSTFSMVTVANFTTPPGCDLAGIQKGDIIIEVNGATTMSIPAVSLKAAIQAQPGDIRLLVARSKEEKETKSLEKKNEEIDNLKKHLATMYRDLQKKSSALQELTSQRNVIIKTRKPEINGNVMSHEAILNALSEDEYIV